MRYPTFEELGDITPDYLTIGANAMHNLAIKPTSVRTLPPEARRLYDRKQRSSWAGRRKLGGTRVA